MSITSNIFIAILGILIGIILERKIIRGGWSSRTFKRLEKKDISVEDDGGKDE